MYVRIRALYVGQGAANLIEVKNTSDEVNCQGLMLIDYGSVGKAGKDNPKDSDEPNKRAAFETIRQVLCDNEGKLDYLILSHLDSDHINLIAELISKKIITEIGCTIVGGTSRCITDESHPFKKNSNMIRGVTRTVRNMATAVAQVCTNINIFSINDGYLDSESKYDIYGNDNEIIYFKLLCNRAISNVKTSEQYINSNSAIVVVEYWKGEEINYLFIFPGDATYETFSHINQRMTQCKEAYPFSKAQVRVLIAPHHSALKTACKNEAITDKETLDEQMVELNRFKNFLRPTHVYASAHYRAKKYSHPNLNALQSYGSYTYDSDEHTYFGFVTRMGNGTPILTLHKAPTYGLYSFLSNKNIYTSHTINVSFDMERVTYEEIPIFNREYHIFGDLVCEIVDGEFKCTYQQI